MGTFFETLKKQQQKRLDTARPSCLNLWDLELISTLSISKLNLRCNCLAIRISLHPIWSGCTCSTVNQTCKLHFLKSIWNLGELDYVRQALWSHYVGFSGVFQIFWEQLPIYFSCLGEHCNAVLLWSSRNFLWTMKLPKTFHWHGGDEIMTKILFSSGTLPLTLASQVEFCHWNFPE